jgi:large conductance mechanosensitive channel
MNPRHVAAIPDRKDDESFGTLYRVFGFIDRSISSPCGTIRCFASFWHSKNISHFRELSKVKLLEVMGFVSEFKDFAMRGNLVDLAVGVVIGGAFGKVVTAFIDGMVMPMISMLTGGVDFNNLFLPLGEKVRVAVAADPTMPLEKAKELGAVIAYGSFITVLIDFLVVALVIFMVIKAMNRLKKKQVEAPAAPAAPAAPTKEEVLLTEIRDALVKRG